MATAQEIVTRAYRRLQAIDLNEQPTAAEMTNGLAALSEMVNSWAADGIKTDSQTLTGNITSGEPYISNLDTTANLGPGMNISGTGIAAGARIKSVCSSSKVEMTLDATASGSPSLTFALMPIDDRLQKAVVAMLAVYIAGDLGLPDASPRVVSDAIEGKDALLAYYLQTPKVTHDAALIYADDRRTYLDLFGG